MAVKIIFGGFARPSFDVKQDNYDTTFNAGQVMTIDASDNTIVKADNTTTGLVGIALDYKLNEKQDTTKGSKKGAIVIDPAVIESDQVASGISPAANDTLYIDADGNITTATGSLKIGKAISYSSGKLTFLFDPQY